MEGPQGNRRPAILTLFRDTWLFVLIPIVVGAPFLLIGLSEAYKTVRLERSWVSTRGTVVDNMTVAFATGASYVPVVDFRTLNGEVVRFADGVGSIPPDYEVGTEVTVLYDPDDVHSARVASWKRLWLAPTIITVVGVLPTLIGVLVIWLVGLRVGFSRGPAR
ncbi:MAG TPA: DUF3592 domain-containing protein [Anaerolineae bacterium]|nr:DUF3592 domain-containing protein [Anaerolineae bacterium]